MGILCQAAPAGPAAYNNLAHFKGKNHCHNLSIQLSMSEFAQLDAGCLFMSPPGHFSYKISL